MMLTPPQPIIQEKNLCFTFPVGWQAIKYDEWGFYLRQFSKQGDIKAVDILALSDDKHAYFIEIKDYQHPGSIKPSELASVIQRKVLDTLAALLPAKLHHSSLPEEKGIAEAVLACKKIHVIAHIEQAPSRPQAVDFKDIRDKLRLKLGAVDPHPRVVTMKSMKEKRGLHWEVCDASPDKQDDSPA